MERLYWISMMAPATHEWWLARLLYPFFLSLAGDISEEATPDPIPNSEVKLFCVDGTAWVTAWESRTSPAFFVFLACVASDGGCVPVGLNS